MPAPSAALRRQLHDLLGPVVERAGYEIDGLSLTTVGRRVLVRLTVDGEHGIDLDAVAEVTRAVSGALDEADPFDSPFVLEVSSPGVDRPLTTERHWRRAVGRLVATGTDGTAFTGRITDVADGMVRLDVDGSERAVALDALEPGRVQIEFNRPTGTDADEADAVGRSADQEGSG